MIIIKVDNYFTLRILEVIKNMNQLLEEEKKNKNAVKDFQLYSFDIFDTLITRLTATPYGIFVLMQDELLSDKKYESIPLYFKKNFAEYRRMSEHYLYSYNDCVNGFMDCTFDEIYENLKSNYNLTDNDVQILKELELKIEYNNIIGIPINVNIIKDLISNGKRVILISDMYHTSEVIRSWLLKVDNIFSDIQIYVSSECKCKKRGSELFKYVQNLENVSFENWHHFGDNEVSDFRDPATLGIEAEKFLYPDIKPYEKRVIGKYVNNCTIQLLIGCAKNVRLMSDYSKFDLGVSLTAPILIPYVLWLLDEAVKKNFKRLYFIARDGYILKEVADYVIKSRNLDIKTKYIYGSRAAWQKPSIAVCLDNLDPIVMQYALNKEFLSKVLGISEKRLTKLLPKSLREYHKNFNKEQRKEILDALKNNQKYVAKLQSENAEKCENLIGYIKQEIDFSDDNFAFVDLSGSGVTQNCLASVINTFYKKSINSFYFRNGIYKVESRNVNRFYFIHRNDACALLELTSRAPHGQTTGYKCNCEGKYEPILDNNDVDTKSWGFDIYLQGILSFVQGYDAIARHYSLDCRFPIIANEYLDWLKTSIDKETADGLGTIVYAHVGSHEGREVAPKITRWQAFKYLLGISDLNTDMYRLSYERSKTSVKKILKYKEIHPDLRKHLIHVHFIKKKKEFFINILGIRISLKSLIWGKDK